MVGHVDICNVWYLLLCESLARGIYLPVFLLKKLFNYTIVNCDHLDGARKLDFASVTQVHTRKAGLQRC